MDVSGGGRATSLASRLVPRTPGQDGRVVFYRMPQKCVPRPGKNCALRGSKLVSLKVGGDAANPVRNVQELDLSRLSDEQLLTLRLAITEAGQRALADKRLVE
jgi:hypothetical protein